MAICRTYARTAMRNAIAMALMLLFSSIAGVSSAEYVEENEEAVSDTSITSTYSIAVQMSLKRAENLESYSQSQLDSTAEWLVITGMGVDSQGASKAQPDSVTMAPFLEGAFIWEFLEPQRAVSDLRESLLSGEIESLSPLVMKK